MSSACHIAISPDGRFVAAHVHQHVAVIERSTGRRLSLPPPQFTRPANSNDADTDADEEDEDEEEQGEEGEQEQEQEGGARKKAKVDTNQAASASASASQQQQPNAGPGQRSHSGPRPMHVLQFHPSGKWLMHDTDDKFLHLYHIDNTYAETSAVGSSSSSNQAADASAAAPVPFKHVCTVTISRKVQSAAFHTTTSPSSLHTLPLSSKLAAHRPPMPGPDEDVGPIPQPGRTPLQLPDLIVADKVGDVFWMHGQDLKQQDMIFGHLALMTNLAQCIVPAPVGGAGAAKQYVLSADSDGKIRVSNSPNYFDIQAFCLGQPAFMSTFVVPPVFQPSARPLVVGGGLGSVLRVWNIQEGNAPIETIDLRRSSSSSQKGASGQGKDQSTAADTEADQDCYISDISMAKTREPGVYELAVTVYPWSQIFLLRFCPASTPSLQLLSSHDAPSSQTPMCICLEPAALAEHSDNNNMRRIWSIDERLHVHATWMDVTGNSEGQVDSIVKDAVSSLDRVFLPAQDERDETLISDTSVSGSGGAATAASLPSTASSQPASISTTSSGRYISPFSSLHSNHLARLTLLSVGGFCFRRYFDKLTRDRFIAQKKAESAERKMKAKMEKKSKKAAAAKEAAASQ